MTCGNLSRNTFLWGGGGGGGFSFANFAKEKKNSKKKLFRVVVQQSKCNSIYFVYTVQKIYKSLHQRKKEKAFNINNNNRELWLNRQ